MPAYRISSFKLDNQTILWLYPGSTFLSHVELESESPPFQILSSSHQTTVCLYPGCSLSQLKLMLDLCQFIIFASYWLIESHTLLCR